MWRRVSVMYCYRFKPVYRGLGQGHLVRYTHKSTRLFEIIIYVSPAPRMSCRRTERTCNMYFLYKYFFSVWLFPFMLIIGTRRMYYYYNIMKPGFKTYKRFTADPTRPGRGERISSSLYIYRARRKKELFSTRAPWNVQCVLADVQEYDDIIIYMFVCLQSCRTRVLGSRDVISFTWLISPAFSQLTNTGHGNNVCARTSYLSRTRSCVCFVIVRSRFPPVFIGKNHRENRPVCRAHVYRNYYDTNHCRDFEFLIKDVRVYEALATDSIRVREKMFAFIYNTIQDESRAERKRNIFQIEQRATTRRYKWNDFHL